MHRFLTEATSYLIDFLNQGATALSFRLVTGEGDAGAPHAVFACGDFVQNLIAMYPFIEGAPLSVCKGGHFVQKRPKCLQISDIPVKPLRDTAAAPKEPHDPSANPQTRRPTPGPSDSPANPHADTLAPESVRQIPSIPRRRTPVPIQRAKVFSQL